MYPFRLDIVQKSAIFVASIFLEDYLQDFIVKHAMKTSTQNAFWLEGHL